MGGICLAKYLLLVRVTAHARLIIILFSISFLFIPILWIRLPGKEDDSFQTNVTGEGGSKTPGARQPSNLCGSSPSFEKLGL